MTAPNRPIPFHSSFWSNNQKRAPNAEFDRFLLIGGAIGKDDELVIRRIGVTGLTEADQMAASVASQTGLHIQILDTRAVLPIKLSKAAANSSHFLRMANIATDGTETLLSGGITNTGQWTNSSLAELKENMKDLTDAQIKKIFEKAKVYRFNFIDDASGTIYVSPEASEFHQLTGFGDAETVAPGTLGAIALRLAQWLYKKVVDFEARLTTLESAK